MMMSQFLGRGRLPAFFRAGNGDLWLPIWDHFPGVWGPSHMAWTLCFQKAPPKGGGTLVDPLEPPPGGYKTGTVRYSPEFSATVRGRVQQHRLSRETARCHPERSEGAESSG